MRIEDSRRTQQALGVWMWGNMERVSWKKRKTNIEMIVLEHEQ